MVSARFQGPGHGVVASLVLAAEATNVRVSSWQQPGGSDAQIVRQVSWSPVRNLGIQHFFQGLPIVIPRLPDRFEALAQNHRFLVWLTKLEQPHSQA